ncbi:MAG: hypothetical protein B7Z63_00570, partial [Ignavibacteriae bacterium 37-53-5]
SIYRAKNTLTILGPKGIRKSTEQLMKLFNTPPEWFREQIDPRTKYLEDKDTDFIRIFPTRHTVPTNAYRVEYRGKTVFYSGDTSYSDNVVEGARDSDYLVHEMTYTDKDRKLADFWRHSTDSDVMKVFDRSGARHLVPVHLTRSSSELVSSMVGKVEGLVYPADLLEI